LLLVLLIQCKISLYLGPVRPVQCFVTPFFTGAILLFDIEHVLFRAINCCHVINTKYFDCLLLCMSTACMCIAFGHYWPNSHGGRGHGDDGVWPEWSFKGATVFYLDLTGSFCCDFEFSFATGWGYHKLLKNESK